MLSTIYPPRLSSSVYSLLLSFLFVIMAGSLVAQPCYWGLDLGDPNYDLESVDHGSLEINSDFWEVNGSTGLSHYQLSPILKLANCPDDLDLFFAFVLNKTGKYEETDRIYLEYTSDMTTEWTSALDLSKTGLNNYDDQAIISGSIPTVEFKDVTSLNIRLGMQTESLNTTFRIYHDQICISTGEFEFCRQLLRDILPLDLLSFEAGNQGKNAVFLAWETANETRVSHFEVERSRNGKVWSSIYSINAKNDPSGSYKLLDDNLEAATYYYRLKMVEEDNSYAYSRVRSVTVDRGMDVKLYPNPVKNTLTLDFQEMTAPRNLIVFDLSGKMIMDVAISETLMTLDVTNLTPGYYTIQILQEDKEFVAQRFIKQ